jgi:hypothetical protein
MYLACESTQRAGVPECGPAPRVGSYHCRAAQLSSCSAQGARRGDSRFDAALLASNPHRFQLTAEVSGFPCIHTGALTAVKGVLTLNDNQRCQAEGFMSTGSGSSRPTVAMGKTVPRSALRGRYGSDITSHRNGEACNSGPAGGRHLRQDKAKCSGGRVGGPAQCASFPESVGAVLYGEPG